MTKAFLAASVVLLGVANAQNFPVSATNIEVCEILSNAAQIDLSNVPVNQWSAPAEFTYRCNFNGSPSLTFVSANGGIQHDSIVGLKADYGIYLNDLDSAQTPAGSLHASASTGAGVTFNGISDATPAGSTRAPVFKVGLIDALTAAGTYTDTLTISIAP